MKWNVKKVGQGDRGTGGQDFFCPTAPLPNCPTRSNRGAIALITIIVIGGMLLAAGISTAFLGQTGIVLAGHADRGPVARVLAEGCMEEALHRLKGDAAYVGGTVPLGVETCTVTVAGAGSTRTITASAAVAGFTRTIVVGASLVQNGAANARSWHIDSWAESDPP